MGGGLSPRTLVFSAEGSRRKPYELFAAKEIAPAASYSRPKRVVQTEPSSSLSATAPAPPTPPVAVGRLPTLATGHLPGVRPAALTQGETWTYLGVLGALVIANVPLLGAEAWRFRPPSVEPVGPLAPLVRMANGDWDPALLRSAALVAGFVLALYAIFALGPTARRRLPLILLTSTVLALLVLPSVLLQAGLREATAPWFFTNDSTYQIELAGDVVASGETPYGHDYSASGLERFYSLKGNSRGSPVATEHFAYFPGTALAAAAWNALPSPWDDFRFLVALATIGSFFAVLLFRAPLLWRLALGAVLVANPLTIRAEWFGNADALGLLLLVLAFAFVTRERYLTAAVLLAGAVLCKQFALVALPFLAVLVLLRAGRRTAGRAAAVFALVAALGIAPFVLADPGAFWADTVTYGVDTYRIVGYGLAALLVRAGLIEGRADAYPFFLLALTVWLPATLVLLRAQVRSRDAWLGGAGFAVSIFVLIFIGRVFHPSYLLWPLAGIVLASLLAARPPAVALPAPLPARAGIRALARGARRRSARRGAEGRPER